MEPRTGAIVINPMDNVATALSPLEAGASVNVEIEGLVDAVTLMDGIPMGHKFAIRDIEQGAAVIKYGEPIGQSTSRIRRGLHVHVHNVVSPSRGGE